MIKKMKELLEAKDYASARAYACGLPVAQRFDALQMILKDCIVRHDGKGAEDVLDCLPKGHRAHLLSKVFAEFVSKK
ncbi:MAG: hypothetical protein WCO55_05635 [Candidatus Falkowbacteria bacterium]